VLEALFIGVLLIVLVVVAVMLFMDS